MTALCCNCRINAVRIKEYLTPLQGHRSCLCQNTGNHWICAELAIESNIH